MTQLESRHPGSARWAARWYVWASALAILYVVAALLAWKRTLTPDEIRPLLLAAGPLGEQMEVARQDLVQTPLSYLVGRAWLRTFGQTDTAAKTLALLINLPTIVLFTYLATGLHRRWRVLSLAFLLPYLRVGSSVNILRMYGLLVLFVVLALLLWDRWRRTGRPVWLAGWVIAMGLAIYSHASALLLLPAFVVANWLFGRKRWTFALGSVVAFATLAPWLAYVAPVFMDRGIEENVQSIAMDPTMAVAQLPFDFLSGEDPGGGSVTTVLQDERYGRPLRWAARLAVLALLVAAATGVRRIWPPQRSEEARNLWIAALLCAIPVLILYGFSLLHTPTVHARYLLIITPMLWWLIVSLADVGGRAGRAILAGLMVWVLTSGVLAIGAHLEDSPVRAGTDLAAERLTPRDLLLCDSHFVGFRVYWEWTRRLGQDGRVEIVETPGLPWLRRILPGTELERLELDGTDRVWLFYTRDTRASDVAEFLARQGFEPDREAAAGVPNLMGFVRQAGGQAAGPTGGLADGQASGDGIPGRAIAVAL